MSEALEDTRTNRAEALERIQAETERWSRYVDTLLRAFQSSPQPPPALGPRITSLQHKRETVLTKVEALKRHQKAGWTRSRREYDEARRELRDAWRLVLTTLQRESLFI